METFTVAHGAKVLIADVDGNEYETTALGPVETEGHYFPVVWVAIPDGYGTGRVPWPAEYVRLLPELAPAA